MFFLWRRKYNRVPNIPTTTKFRLSYDLLNKSKRYKLIQDCLKRYLLTHIVSSVIYIEPSNWETAIFLPTQKMVYKK